MMPYDYTRPKWVHVRVKNMHRKELLEVPIVVGHWNDKSLFSSIVAGHWNDKSLFLSIVVGHWNDKSLF